VALKQLNFLELTAKKRLKMLMTRIPGYRSKSIPITRLVYKQRLPHNNNN